HEASRPPLPRPEPTWLDEIGWHNRTRKTETPEADPPKSEPVYRAAPMHRRSLLVDEAQRYGRLAPKNTLSPGAAQNRTRIKSPAPRGSLTPISVGLLALAIGIIS